MKRILIIGSLITVTMLVLLPTTSAVQFNAVENRYDAVAFREKLEEMKGITSRYFLGKVLLSILANILQNRKHTMLDRWVFWSQLAHEGPHGPEHMIPYLLSSFALKRASILERIVHIISNWIFRGWIVFKPIYMR